MAKLLPGGTLGGTIGLLGSHWEYVSMIYRALGAKIGKRVFWPGSGVKIVEYDLFEVGNDVVWGSRCAVYCSDASSAARVKLEDGANVADRCIIMKGTTVGRNACLGSGSYAPPNSTYGGGSISVGNLHGAAMELEGPNSETEKAETIKPYGRTFYGDGPKGFNVIPWWAWPMYNIPVNVFITWYKTIPLIMSWALSDDSLGYPVFQELDVSALDERESRGVTLVKYYGVLLAWYILVHLIFIAMALFIEVGSKWTIIGCRCECHSLAMSCVDLSY